MADYTGETNRFGNAVALPFTSFATETPDLLDLAYSADDLTRQNDMFWLDGVRHDSGDWENGDGAVRWINGFNIAVRPFRAHINGTIVYADQIILAVEPEDASTRIDSVVIRRDYLARKADVMMLKGEPGSGLPPELRYNHFGVADYELARITISNSMVSLSQSDITDLRRPLMADFGIRPLPGDVGKSVFVDSVGGLQLQYPGIFPGKIDLLTVRPAELALYAPGWHFCNGDLYPLSSPVGKALNALPDSLKSDFGITLSNSNISIPNMFYSDGRGVFVRAGTTPGVVADDAIRNIKGGTGSAAGAGTTGVGTARNIYQSGPFYLTDSAYRGPAASSSSGTGFGPAGFDASRADGVQVAEENRPLNITMTPAIFLGV